MRKQPLRISFTDYRLFRNPLTLLEKTQRWRAVARQLKLSKQALKRLEWFIHYHTKAEKEASKTIRYFGISKSVFYKWLAVFNPTNLKALEDDSRAPHHLRQKDLPAVVVDRVLKLRKDFPCWGKMKLQNLYKTRYQEGISSWKAQLVIEQFHLARKPSKAGQAFKKTSISKRKTVELKKEQIPGFLVAFDTVVLFRNGLRRYIVVAIDVVSKVAWARMYTTHSSITTKDLFQRLYTITQGHILNICHDNGSEFAKHFAAILAELKIPQYFSRLATPKDNATAERFIHTLKEEFLRQGNYTPNVEEFNRRLEQWLIQYNTIRPHQSLNYRKPAEVHSQYFQQPLLVHDVVI